MKLIILSVVILQITFLFPALAGGDKPLFTLINRGITVRFYASDIVSTQYLGDQATGSAFLKIAITSEMSSRLAAYTTGLVGHKIATIIGGKIATCGTLVRTPITGTELHILGHAQEPFRQIAEGLEMRRQNAENDDALITTLELLQFLTISGSQIETIQFNGQQARVIIEQISADKFFAFASTSKKDNWLVVLNGHVVRKWRTISHDGTFALIIDQLSRSQIDALRQRISSRSNDCQ